MPRVKFTKPFDYVPSQYQGRVTMSYKPGREYSVKQECADQAGEIAITVRKQAEKKDDE